MFITTAMAQRIWRCEYITYSNLFKPRSYL